MKTVNSIAKHPTGGTLALARQPEYLQDLVRQIVSIAHPLKVVLFGSRARGDARPDSDFDLLVLMPNGVHRRRTSQKLHKKVPSKGIPFDLVVSTPQDLERYGYHPSLVYKHILEEGIDLYVA